MKRIITCPKCEAKLAIFDLGKPLNQKCPKCGNAFVVESEEKKEPAKGETVAEEPTKSIAEKPNKSAASQTAEAPVKTTDGGSASLSDAAADARADEKAPPPDANKKGEPTSSDHSATPSAEGKASADDSKKSPLSKDKEIVLKKPSGRPALNVNPPMAAPSDPSLPGATAASEVSAPGGHSLLFSMVVVGLLILVVVMQVMTKIRADKQYRTLIEHLQFIETKLAK